MESIDTILETLKGMHDSDRQWTIARKVALNEAYFNVGLIDVIETKAVQGSRSDRNKLIMKLQTASRGAFDIYNIDKGLFGKLLHRAKGMIGGAAKDESQRFTGWTETELHHDVVTKIDILKAIIGAGLSNESKLRIDQRVNNIKHATMALIDRIGA